MNKLTAILWRMALAVCGIHFTVWLASQIDSRRERAAAERRAYVDANAAFIASMRESLAAARVAATAAATPAAQAAAPSGVRVVHVKNAAELQAAIASAAQTSQLEARAYLRSQGHSEILAPGGPEFYVAVPYPIPLHPRAIEGAEVRAKVPLPITSGDHLMLLLAMAKPMYDKRRNTKS